MDNVIELRFYSKKISSPKILQFRENTNPDKADWRDYEWCEWQDVPLFIQSVKDGEEYLPDVQEENNG